MPVEGCWGDPMDDLQSATVSEELSGGGEQLRVEGVELVRIGMSPQGETIDSTDDLKRAVECGYDVCTGESIGLPRH